MIQKNGFLGLCALLLVAFNIANAAITEVIVYPRGAQIKEERVVELKAGENNIEWGSFSQAVDPESLRLIGPVRLLDQTVDTVYAAVEQNARRATLESKLEAAQSRLNQINDHLEVIAKTQTYLDQIQQSSTMPVKGESSYAFPAPTQWQGIIDFLQSARTANQKESREATAAQLPAQQEVDSLKAQLAELDNAPTLFSKKITFKVESPKTQRATLALSYLDPSASWRPGYQVWVDSTTKKINLTYAAFIHQSTQSDWKDVVLTLSTARAGRNSAPPKLTDWWIREHQENVIRPMMAGAMSKASMNGATASYAEDAMEPQLMDATTHVQQNLTFAQFKISGKISVPMDKDDQEHRFLVSEMPLTGELSYKIVPELSTEAYLQAKVTNTGDYTLLPGMLQRYIDGNFVGQGMVKAVQPGETFDLDLGVDPAIKVERKFLSRKTEDSGVLQDNKKITFVYSLELTNLKKSPQKLQILERLPASQHEKIKVELIEPKNMSKNIDREGRLTIDQTLEAGQKLILPLSYSVEFPKKMQVDGL